MSNKVRKQYVEILMLHDGHLQRQEQLLDEKKPQQFDLDPEAVAFRYCDEMTIPESKKKGVRQIKKYTKWFILNAKQEAAVEAFEKK